MAPHSRLPVAGEEARSARRSRSGGSGQGRGARPRGSSAGATSLGRVLDFMRLLWAVDHASTRISRRLERSAGVTGPQRLVVRLVGQRPGISAGELAETLHLHPSTLTEVLRRLTERGALQRRQDPADSRRALFWLTRKGRALDARRSGTAEARVQGVLRVLSPHDLAAAARVLSRLAQALS